MTTREPWHSIDPAHAGDLDRLAEHLKIAIWKPEAADTGRARTIGRSARESLRDRLPPRYATDSWRIPYDVLLRETLAPGLRILDVGAGSLPVRAAGQRPDGCDYVGLDVDRDELEKAPPGSYTDFAVADITDLQDELVGQFDLVLSWLTMEHVVDVPLALDNLRRYLKPGGRFIGYLAGARSVHAVLNRLVPPTVAKWGMRRLIDREPETVFKAHYDHCTYTQLCSVLDGWTAGTVTPVFTGGWYFRFSPLLRAPYLGFEEWAYTGDHRNLATYYIVDATA